MPDVLRWLDAAGHSEGIAAVWRVECVDMELGQNSRHEQAMMTPAAMIAKSRLSITVSGRAGLPQSPARPTVEFP
jgi:hypothetical protein